MIIPMAKPSMGPQELKLVEEVFASGWLGEGHWTGEFEKEIARFTGSEHVVAVNTGTSALHLALHAMGVGPGDEVILPSMTFVSDPQAVIMCGAKPVFCDIEEETLNLNPARIEALLTARTKAVMPTDFAGLPSDVPAIRAVVGERIRIIRDASHSFGSKINGKVVGVHDGEDATCFSFDPIKNLTCGEGGAALLRDAALAEGMRSQKMLGIVRSSWIGFSQKKVEDRRVVQEGFRYHMSNINAAIGLAQFKKFRTFSKNRQKLARRYDELFSDNPHVRIFKRDYDALVPFMYVIRVAAEAQEGLISHLVKSGIHAGLRYFPCHLQPFFEHAGAQLPVTERLAREMISIPLYSGLNLSDIKSIVTAINSYFR
jgi:perosamine synthetase